MDAEDEIKNVLEKYRTVAVVGLSRDSAKDSYTVAEYLQSMGYKIVPINPFTDEVLGEKCYKSLLEVSEDVQKSIEIVDIFRPAQDVPPIVDQAVQLRKKHGKPHVIWMQLGIVNEEAAKRAADAGLIVIMDRCMMMEHRHLGKPSDQELQHIRARKRQELATLSKGEAGLQKESISVPITVEDANFNHIVQRYPLMVIDCWATWCGPCRMIAPTIDELAKDYAGRVVFGKLNVDENSETAMRFEIVSIPTLLIMKNGREVDRIIGAVPRQFIEERLNKHL